MVILGAKLPCEVLRYLEKSNRLFGSVCFIKNYHETELYAYTLICAVRKVPIDGWAWLKHLQAIS